MQEQRKGQKITEVNFMANKVVSTFKFYTEYEKNICYLAEHCMKRKHLCLG